MSMYAHSTPLQSALVSRATSALPAALRIMLRAESTRQCYRTSSAPPHKHTHPHTVYFLSTHKQGRYGLHRHNTRAAHSLKLQQQRPVASSRATTAAASVAAEPASAQLLGKRYAVIGGGFAGIAVAWHLLAGSTASQPVSVDLYDVAGIGMGGSGAAAGLMHPFSPKGKLLWRGEEAMADALNLVAAAEAAQLSAAAAQGRRQAEGDDTETGAERTTYSDGGPFVWRQPMMRAAISFKQARDLSAVQLEREGFSAQRLTTDQMIALVPGITQSGLQPCIGTPPQPPPAGEMECTEGVPPLGDHLAAAGTDLGVVGGATGKGLDCEGGGGTADTCANAQSMPRLGRKAEVGPQPYSGILINGGLALHPHRYLEALWESCRQAAAQHGGRVSLHRSAVHSLAQLEDERGPHAAVIVATGAAVGTIAETCNLFPLSLSQGYVLDMVPGHIGRPYPELSPSLLGAIYVTAQGRRRLLVGATKRPGLTPQEAFQECGRAVESAAEIQLATEALQPLGEARWERLGQWEVDAVKTGVRALPTKTPQGAMPFAGRVDSGSHPQCRWWAVTGLGARGLVYHGWLGRLVAEAIAEDDEGVLPPELLRWRQ